MTQKVCNYFNNIGMLDLKKCEVLQHHHFP